MSRGRPKIDRPSEDIYRIFNADYTKAILETSRRPFQTYIRDAVVNAMDIICSIISHGNIYGYRCYKNDLIETLVAWIISDPEILDKYLKENWGISLFPKNRSIVKIIKCQKKDIGGDHPCLEEDHVLVASSIKEVQPRNEGGEPQ